MKFIHGPKIYEEFVFTYKSGEKIIIGRKQTCDIHFDIEDN